MYRLKLTAILVIASLLSACSGIDVEDYAEQSPPLDLQSFFSGDIKAWGIVQDWRGRVVNRFEVDMQGKWDASGKGILDETFVYANGDQQLRQWRFTKLADNSYTGEADDVIGTARIDQAGNALNLRYQLLVPVGDKEYRLNFDDWMWLVDDQVIINRAKMSKFGLPVAELIVVMQKQ